MASDSGSNSLMLPASGRPERLDAQIARLERRLVEAEQATTFGDSIAASDAIAAYRLELGDTAPSWPMRMAHASVRSWLATRSSWPSSGPVCWARRSRRPMRRSIR